VTTGICRQLDKFLNLGVKVNNIKIAHKIPTKFKKPQKIEIRLFSKHNQEKILRSKRTKFIRLQKVQNHTKQKTTEKTQLVAQCTWG